MSSPKQQSSSSTGGKVESSTAKMDSTGGTGPARSSTNTNAGGASSKVEQVNIKNVRGPGVSDVGSFRVMGDLFGWRNSRTGEIIQLECGSIEDIEWIRISSREYLLSFIIKDKKIEFSGFKEHDFELLQNYFKKYWNKTISTQNKISTKGWHWGQWSIAHQTFALEIDQKRAIQIPLNQLLTVTTNKADIAFELKRSDHISSNEDVVTEIKFCVPPPKEGDPADTAEFIKASIIDASGLGSSENSALVCAFLYKNCLQPPGRFDIQFYPSSIRLHGKSFDYRILFDNIAAAYVLSDVQSSKLLLTLVNPLKKGNTKYPAVIVCLEDKVEETMTVNTTPELLEELKKIVAVPDGSTEITIMEPLMAGHLLKILGSKRLLGETDFKSATGHPSFVCSHKIHSGWFYPLDQEFVYLAKPVITVPYAEVLAVNLGRTQGQQTRLFEFSITLKSGTEYEFNQVDRQELQPLVEFVQKKGLRIKEMMTETREEVERDDDDDDDDDDNDDNDEEQDSEEEDEDFDDEEEEE